MHGRPRVGGGQLPGRPCSAPRQHAVLDALLGGLVHLHQEVLQEVLQVVVQAVGAGQAEAKVAAVQGRRPFPLHDLQAGPTQPRLQLRRGRGQTRQGCSSHSLPWGTPPLTFTRTRLLSLGLLADRSCPKPR